MSGPLPSHFENTDHQQMLMEVVCEQFEAMHAPTAQEMKALVKLPRHNMGPELEVLHEAQTHLGL